jgi:hypothetical protein
MTEDGTVAADGVSLDRFTVWSVSGTEESVTVPMLLTPPATAGGAKLIEATDRGLTVSSAVLETEL